MNSPAPSVPGAFDEGGPLVVLRRQLEQRAAEFQMVLPSHITAEKLQRTVLTAVQLNPDLLGCERRSFLTACMKAAQDGLLPDGREAAIVPFKTRFKDPQRGWVDLKTAAYMPMVFGLRKKILQSGEVADLFAAVVYRQEIDRDLFHYEEGSQRTLRHRPCLDPDFRPTDDDIALAYSVATFADGSQSFEVMRRFEIDDVREASQTGARFDKKGEPREAKGPWQDWFAEMAKKTVIRRHSKSLPQSGDIIVDVEAEDMRLAAAKSAVALLDSRQPDAPETADKLDEIHRRGIEHAKNDPPETPAYIEPEITEPDPKPEQEPDEAPDEVPEPLTEAPQPAPVEAPEEPEPEAELGSNGPGDFGLSDLDPQPDEVKTESQEPEETDDVGVTKEADEKLAESYISRARACELLLDLRALAKEAEFDLATMRPEIAACVDTELDNARKRLTPPAKKKPS